MRGGGGGVGEAWWRGEIESILTHLVRKGERGTVSTKK